MSDALLLQLRATLGDRVSTGESILAHHARGEGWDQPRLPAAVCFPHSDHEVAAVLRVCAAHHVPVVPFGAGTSLEGHVVPLFGGVSLDLTRMNQVLEVNELDLDCRVQAGVTRKQLDEHLGPRGLFFPVDPGADATFGGMVACGASGTTTVRYGSMRHNVLGLTVVLADGRIIRTGGRARKSSAGYDLTRLFVGSEGTLGVITEVAVRLYGIPEAVSAAVCQFDEIDSAVNTVIEAIQLSIPLARAELIDDVQMGASIRYSKLDEFEAKPTIFLEFHGTPAAVDEQAIQVGALCRAHGGGTFRRASHREDRSRLWKARHEAYFAALALAPGKRGITTDVCVPISRLADCIRETRQDIERSGIIAPVVGHIGDGNFHAVILCHPEDPAEIGRGKEFNARLVQRALSMGGTCTGEHGVGYGKITFVEAEHGDGVLAMRAIKDALDPLGIMNPGKVLRATAPQPRSNF